MLTPGERIDRYRVERPLGSGGMGAVYRATDPRLGRDVAIKVLRSDWAGPEAIARFVREARVVASLNHPNAVHVYDVLPVDGAHAIVMELIEGVTLRRALFESNATWRVRVRWLLDVARAVAAAHEARLIHRDLKPDNVMVRTRDGVTKVLDFGLARQLEAGDDTPAPIDAPGSALTTKGRSIGTPGYMSPEQMCGDPVDARCDQFSWGVTAYEVFARAFPWAPYGDMVTLMQRVLTWTPTPIGERVPELPQEISDAVMRTLSKDPAARFPAMHSLIAALEPYAESDSRALIAAVPGDVDPMAQTQGSNKVRLPTQSSPKATPPARAVNADARSGRAQVETLASPVTPSAKSDAKSGAKSDAKSDAAARAIDAASMPRAVRAVPRRPIAWAAIVALGVGVGVAALTARALRSKASSPPVAASTSIGAASAIAPISSVPEAAREYTIAVETWRHDADMDGIGHFQNAAKADASLCAAHLRVALYSAYDGDKPQEHFAKARACADHLSPTDHALLDAFSPLFDAEPDANEHRARLAALAAAHGNDPEIVYLHGRAMMSERDLADAAIVEFDRAIVLDPRFVHAYAKKAKVLQEARRLADADRAIDACLVAVPKSALCRWAKLDALAHGTDCAAHEREARKAVALMMSDSNPYSWLASALFDAGAPRESVVEAMRQESLHSLRSPLTDYHDIAWRSNSEQAFGDFDAALADLAKIDVIDAETLASQARVDHALERAQILDEVGRADDAKKLIADLYKTSRAFTDASTMPIAFLAAARRAGALTTEALDRARATSLERMKSADPVARWLDAYASFAETDEELREAIATMPPIASVAAFEEGMMLGDARVQIGAVLARAGRRDEALPRLRRGLAQCDEWEWTFAAPRAQLLFGAELEASGDRAGAKAAYRKVLVRWGDAKPRSRTADAARARLAAIDK